MNTYKIICIVGLSGCGKTTLSCKLKELYNIPYICSYTTRNMRDGETNGIEHRFVNISDMPDSSEMCAYTLFGNNHYWTTFSQIEENPISTYIIDEKGILYFKEKCKYHPNYIVKYVKIIRDNLSSIDIHRKDRDNDRINIPDDQYDLILYNNGSIEETCKTFINWLQNL